jgi:autophagy-related protein 18
MGGYLPNTLTEMWEPQRDFAFLKLPISGVRSAVAMSRRVPSPLLLLNS